MAKRWLMMHVKIRERCFQTVEYVVARTSIPRNSGDVYLHSFENFLHPIRASLFPQPLQAHSRAGQTFLHNTLRLALLVAAVDSLDIFRHGRSHSCSGYAESYETKIEAASNDRKIILREYTAYRVP